MRSEGQHGDDESRGDAVPEGVSQLQVPLRLAAWHRSQQQRQQPQQQQPCAPSSRRGQQLPDGDRGGNGARTLVVELSDAERRAGPGLVAAAVTLLDEMQAAEPAWMLAAYVEVIARSKQGEAVEEAETRFSELAAQLMPRPFTLSESVELREFVAAALLLAATRIVHRRSRQQSQPRQPGESPSAAQHNRHPLRSTISTGHASGLSSFAATSTSTPPPRQQMSLGRDEAFRRLARIWTNGIIRSSRDATAQKVLEAMLAIVVNPRVVRIATRNAALNVVVNDAEALRDLMTMLRFVPDEEDDLFVKIANSVYDVVRRLVQNNQTHSADDEMMMMMMCPDLLQFASNVFAFADRFFNMQPPMPKTKNVDSQKFALLGEVLIRDEAIRRAVTPDAWLVAARLLSCLPFADTAKLVIVEFVMALFDVLNSPPEPRQPRRVDAVVSALSILFEKFPQLLTMDGPSSSNAARGTTTRLAVTTPAPSIIYPSACVSTRICDFLVKNISDSVTMLTQLHTQEQLSSVDKCLPAVTLIDRCRGLLNTDITSPVLSQAIMKLLAQDDAFEPRAAACIAYLRGGDLLLSEDARLAIGAAVLALVDDRHPLVRVCALRCVDHVDLSCVLQLGVMHRCFLSVQRACEMAPRPEQGDADRYCIFVCYRFLGRVQKEKDKVVDPELVNAAVSTFHRHAPGLVHSVLALMDNENAVDPLLWLRAANMLVVSAPTASAEVRALVVAQAMTMLTTVNGGATAWLLNRGSVTDPVMLPMIAGHNMPGPLLPTPSPGPDDHRSNIEKKIARLFSQFRREFAAIFAERLFDAQLLRAAVIAADHDDMPESARLPIFESAFATLLSGGGLGGTSYAIAVANGLAKMLRRYSARRITDAATDAAIAKLFPRALPFFSRALTLRSPTPSPNTSTPAYRDPAFKQLVTEFVQQVDESIKVLELLLTMDGVLQVPDCRRVLAAHAFDLLAAIEGFVRRRDLPLLHIKLARLTNAIARASRPVMTDSTFAAFTAGALSVWGTYDEKFEEKEREATVHAVTACVAHGWREMLDGVHSYDGIDSALRVVAQFPTRPSVSGHRNTSLANLYAQLELRLGVTAIRATHAARDSNDAKRGRENNKPNQNAPTAPTGDDFSLIESVFLSIAAVIHRLLILATQPSAVKVSVRRDADWIFDRTQQLHRLSPFANNTTKEPHAWFDHAMFRIRNLEVDEKRLFNAATAIEFLSVVSAVLCGYSPRVGEASDRMGTAHMMLEDFFKVVHATVERVGKPGFVSACCVAFTSLNDILVASQIGPLKALLFPAAAHPMPAQSLPALVARVLAPTLAYLRNDHELAAAPTHRAVTAAAARVLVTVCRWFPEALWALEGVAHPPQGSSSMASRRRVANEVLALLVSHMPCVGDSVEVAAAEMSAAVLDWFDAQPTTVGTASGAASEQDDSRQDVLAFATPEAVRALAQAAAQSKHAKKDVRRRLLEMASGGNPDADEQVDIEGDESTVGKPGVATAGKKPKRLRPERTP